MAARIKVTTYLTPALAETVKRLAMVHDRSVSDVIEEAVIRRLADTGRDAEQAALMARLDAMIRQIGRMDHAQETHFEMSAQIARFVLSVSPDIPEGDRPTFEARGNERLRNILSIVVARLAGNRSVGRETLNQIAAAQPGHPASRREPSPTVQEAAE